MRIPYVFVCFFSQKTPHSLTLTAISHILRTLSPFISMRIAAALTLLPFLTHGALFGPLLPVTVLVQAFIGLYLPLKIFWIRFPPKVIVSRFYSAE